MWVNIPFMDPTGFQQKSSNQRSHNSYVGRPNDPCFHSKSQLHNSLEFIKIQSSQTTCIHFIYHLKHTAAHFDVLSRSCIFVPPGKKILKLIKSPKKLVSMKHHQLSTSTTFRNAEKSRPDWCLIQNMGHWLDIEIHQQVGQLRTFHHSTTILRGVGGEGCWSRGVGGWPSGTKTTRCFFCTKNEKIC